MGQFSLEVLDEYVIINKFISIKGQGRGPGGTKLYRREDVPDDVLAGSSWQYMFYYNCNSDQSSEIVISDIHFKGKNPSLVPGDGGSSASDYGIRMTKCVDFVITNNRFEHFGRAGISIRHRDTLARGLINSNEFIHNLKVDPQVAGGTTLGYGVVVIGDDQGWVSEPKFGTDNFIFIEDNYFLEHRHAVAGAGTALYVFRYNTVVDNLWGQAVDAHGGGKHGNTYSTRAYEVYNNNIYNTKFKDGVPLTELPTISICYDLTYRAMHFRGGEGVIYNNTIEGFLYGIGVTTEITGDYPVITQIGYQSGLDFGANHSGISDPRSKDDLFEWNNEFIPYDNSGCISSFRNFRASLLEEGRDYHLETPKPKYVPYPYPHPLSQ